jgi:NitT/TauT family transport system permease protein
MARLSGKERYAAIASPIVFLACWELLARTGVLDARILPPPTAVVETAVEMVRKERLLEHTGTTVLRFLVGMVLGVVPGIFIGLTMGLFRWVHAILNPLVAIFYPVPRIALFPLVLILVGMNETSNILMIALGPLFTMLIAAMAGVMSVDPIYREVARNFNATHRQLYFMVTLPAAMPAVMGGIRISLGLALLGTVAVEFLVGESGLGHVIWNSWQTLSLKRCMVGIVMSAAVGSFFYLSMDALERWLMPWHRPATIQ